ncbi:Hypothetical protein KK9_2012 (plasmid) [Borreliella garinii BgVir]|nr:Hypothetical protein KK9_2012 [Borreliella garinii BgVir]
MFVNINDVVLLPTPPLIDAIVLFLVFFYPI